LAGDFLTITWQSTQQMVTGNFQSGQETAFYSTSSMITGVGQYAAQNNLGQPITLTVIRHYVQNDAKFSEDMTSAEINQREASGQQRGVFWGTASGPTGSANIIGASMTWTENNVTTSGFVPLINHDALTSFYLTDEPSLPASDFKFAMMSETWDPAAPPPGPPEECAICLPPASGTWCPNQDAAVIAARNALKLCLAEAAVTYAGAVAALVASLVYATKMCVATCNPLTIAACLALTYAAYMMAMRIAFTLFAGALGFCWDAYENAFAAALAAACPNGASP
jgi:hypothetical protein